MDSMFSIGVRFSTTIFLGINFEKKTPTQLPQVRSRKQIGAEFNFVCQIMGNGLLYADYCFGKAPILSIAFVA